MENALTPMKLYYYNYFQNNFTSSTAWRRDMVLISYSSAALMKVSVLCYLPPNPPSKNKQACVWWQVCCVLGKFTINLSKTGLYFWYPLDCNVVWTYLYVSTHMPNMNEYPPEVLTEVHVWDKYQHGKHILYFWCPTWVTRPSHEGLKEQLQCC